ncbi:SOS response-associated peptidase family protein [Leucobacter sp. CSA1]|uniref:SOS response-associated peptidase family protein n=2 Tax=Leucobacter chromiisoli TaxID=2796471 RepID=A0A934UTA9_9MICO|nr:SOS response-associated peptidase family protein [Leucobacter chromiisoli]
MLGAWVAEHDGVARITGRKARNLNPVIVPRAEYASPAPAAPPATGTHRVPRELVLGWWWLHVGGEPAAYSAFNSRDDQLLRSWRQAFQRRAILPATWYVEKGRTFELPGGAPFGIAAITAVSPQPDGSELLSYSMVTRDAVGEARSAHPRMPLVLPREFHDDWLDPARPGDADLVAEVVLASAGLARAMRPRVGGGGARRAPSAQPTLF